MSPPSVKGEAEEDPARARSARSSIFLMQMKGFGKVALVFVLLGGLMAYFIIPVQFSRKRALSPADKAEYALTVNYYESHCGPVLPEIEERAKAYARESGEDIWAGFDALLQHRGRVIGSPMTWCRALAQALCIAYTTQHGSAPASQAAFLPRPAAKIALLSPDDGLTRWRAIRPRPARREAGVKPGPPLHACAPPAWARPQ